jgi:hypothetical protein
MLVSIHNPDPYMASLRQLVAQGRKRLGILVGAGAPAGIFPNNDGVPLIPAVAGLTETILKNLDSKYGRQIKALKEELDNPNIEVLLTRVRSLAPLIGKTPVHGLDGDGYKQFGAEICEQIGKVVSQRLPDGINPYTELTTWVSGIERNHPVEIFTTNYDQLFEQAFERNRVPYFDGFTGSYEPFFDPSSVATNDLPARWVRLWKLHGSLGWSSNAKGEVIRVAGATSTHLVFPEHIKYEQTQKAPYSALFDRLRDFLLTPDTLLLTVGFSFADAHISARISECLAANPSASVFAFQFKSLDEEPYAKEIAMSRSNMSVYAKDKAVINGVAAVWQPGDLPSKDWGGIRKTYWDTAASDQPPSFLLGGFASFCRFFAGCRSSMGYLVSEQIANVEQATQ